jgi:2-polyprenyl-3-methyl-5-hydroxy-6-metoxy-1,4-benzoquinol methylase
MDFHSECLICRGKKLIDLKRYPNAFLVKCDTCGFIFSKSIPSMEELTEHYREYSYGQETYLSPVTVKRFNELLDEFEKYRITNRILDVGCGAGFFLQSAIKRGWEVYGTEYSETAVQLCRRKGITMFQGILDSKKFGGMEFDVITSLEVIEHINNPLAEMLNIASLLRKGGLYFSTTPNFNGLLRYYLKDKYNIIVYPEHLCYYTPKTLNYLYKKSGLKRIKIFTSGISITRLKTSIDPNKLVEFETSDDEKLRQQLEKKWYLRLFKEVMNSFFGITGTGATIKAYYVKPD